MTTARIIRRVRRSWVDAMGRGRITWEHLAALRANLRLLRENERELADALRNQMSRLEERLLPDAARLLAEWDAVERSIRPRAAKMQALRTLFGTLAEKYALTQCGKSTTP